MNLIQLILFTSGILLILLAAFSFKLFFSKDAKLPGGSCQNRSPELKDRGIGCTCGGEGGDKCHNKES